MRTELGTPGLLRRLLIALSRPFSAPFPVRRPAPLHVTLKATLSVALLTAALTLAAGCVGASPTESSSETETPTSSSSSEADPSQTTDAQAAPQYCYQLSSFDMSLTFLLFSFVSVVSDEMEGNSSSRLEVAQEVGRVAEDASSLSYSVPADLALAVLTVGEAVLAAGERINAGDSISDAWDEMGGQKYQAARDLIDERLEWGECAGY